MNNLLDNLFSDLYALNEKTYELCCRHRRNADKISDDLNQKIDTAIAFEYTQKLEVHKSELENTVTTAVYILKEIHSKTTPEKKRRWYWPFSMKRFGASKQIDDAINAEITQNELLNEILDTVEDMKNKFLRHLKTIPAEEDPDKAPETKEPAGDAKTPPANGAPKTEKPSGDKKAPPANGAPPKPTEKKDPPEPTEVWENENDTIPDKTVPGSLKK